MSFFETFRNYTLLGKITPPKIKVENFTQKINSYFNTINQPVLIVLDSFDAIVKENKTEVLNFCKTSYKNSENVKVVLISKTFSTDDFSDVDYDKVTLLAFSQKIF